MVHVATFKNYGIPAKLQVWHACNCAKESLVFKSLQQVRVRILQGGKYKTVSLLGIDIAITTVTRTIASLSAAQLV